MSPKIENSEKMIDSIEKPASGLPEQNIEGKDPYQIDKKNLEMIAKLMELKSNPEFVEFVQGKLGKGQKFGSLTKEQLVQFAKGYEKMALYKKDPGFIEYVKGRDVNKLNWKEVEIYADGYEKRKIHEAKLKSKNIIAGQGAVGGFDSVVVTGDGSGEGSAEKNNTTDQVVVGKKTKDQKSAEKNREHNNNKKDEKIENKEGKIGYVKTSAQRVEELKKTVKLTEEESKLLSSWDSKKVNDLQYEMEYFAKSGKHKEEEREAYKQHLIKKYGTENKTEQSKKEEKKEENKENKIEQKTEQTTKSQEGQTTNHTVENVLEKTIQNPDGSKTRQVFEPDGKLTTEIVMFPDGSQAGKKYDVAGKVIGEYKMEKNGYMKTTEFRKDDKGQEMKVETFQSADKKNTSVTETRADDSKTETKSDVNGKEITVWDKDGKVIEHKIEKTNEATNPTDQTVVENKPEVSQMEKILNWSNDLQKSGMSQDDIQKLLNSDESKKFLQSKEDQIDWGNKDNLEKYAEWRQDIIKDLPDKLNKIEKYQILHKLDLIVGGKEADKVEQMYNDYFLKENVDDPTKPGVWDTIKKNALGTILPYITRYTNKIPGMDEVRDWTGFNLRHFVQSEPDTWADFSWKEKLFLLGKANQYGSVLDDFKTKSLPVEYLEEWLSDEKNNTEILKLIKEPKKNSGDVTK